MSVDTIPIATDDPLNARILSVSEDKMQGFYRNPIRSIAKQAGVSADDVVTRIRAMLEGGTIRRVRQTLMATNLAPGALVAWKVPEARLNEIFDCMFQQDPFSGHVVIRTTDEGKTGARYRLWTTIKVPKPYSLEKHCELLCEKTGAEAFRLMPAKSIFALGVGHVRRRSMEPGDRAEQPAEPRQVEVVELSDLDWQVVMALKREFAPAELQDDPWANRAEEAGLPIEQFFEVAEDLQARKVVGRFSTFLEHSKELTTGERVTRYNALFHWAVPEGREIEAGREVGRHHIMTHCYWREGGPEFGNVNIMGVVHGMERKRVFEHKQAIDDHLAACGIPLGYTNVFWGGRSEIKPSEISPTVYQEWCASIGVDVETMEA
ncbi:MAG: AsnC family transcriptional regulator [Gemmatimonadetes bacterium]|nr:AsnC family transcriptional regulator [Gemmatimonadota bacterium]